MKRWESIADGLSREGWAYGCVFYFDDEERRMFMVQARREGSGHFIIYADNILTAFLELETQCRAAVGSPRI